MRTPNKYINNLVNNIITGDMLALCLYSCNKRAKNYRDKEKEYRDKRKYGYYYDKYGNEEKNREKKREYYAKKDKLLSIISIQCIHKETCVHTRRIYDDNEEYEEYLQSGDYIDSDCYYDYGRGDDVYFLVVKQVEYRYYLFYEVDEYSFHTPIEEERLSDYKDLEIKEIDQLQTEGKIITDLLSVNFVDKVLSLIESKDYKLIM